MSVKRVERNPKNPLWLRRPDGERAFGAAEAEGIATGEEAAAGLGYATTILVLPHEVSIRGNTDEGSGIGDATAGC